MEFAKDDLQVIQVIKDDSGPFFYRVGLFVFKGVEIGQVQ